MVASVGAGVSLLLVAGSAATQQDDQEWLRGCERQAERSERAVFCEVRPATLQLAGGGLEVDAGRNGGIAVRGGAVGDVRVSARVQAHAPTDARAREIAGAIRIHASDGRVSADGPGTGEREGWSVTYHIMVPNRADLDLTAVNGPITIRHVVGRVRAETRNGPLSLQDLAGDVYGRTRNGPLEVTLGGSRWDGPGMDAETRNGPVTVSVPEGYSAALETGSINGRLTVGFPIAVTLSGRRTDRLQVTLGSGGPPVRVVTTNGPAAVTRRSGVD